MWMAVLGRRLGHAGDHTLMDGVSALVKKQKNHKVSPQLSPWQDTEKLRVGGPYETSHWDPSTRTP